LSGIAAGKPFAARIDAFPIGEFESETMTVDPKGDSETRNA